MRVAKHMGWFMLGGCGLVVSSELLSNLEPAGVLSALMGVAGYAIFAVAIAAFGVASGTALWFLMTAGLIGVVGVLFVLPHRPGYSLGLATIAMVASAGFAFWRRHRRQRPPHV